MPFTLGTLASSTLQPVVVTYVPTTAVTISGGGSTMGFSNVPIGDAYSTRLVIAVFGYGGGESDQSVTINSATIGGISASTAYFRQVRYSGDQMTAAVYAIVPSNTIANVTINFNKDPSDSSGAACACYAIDANSLESTTPIFSGTDGVGTSVAEVLSVEDVLYKYGGFVLASSAKDGNSDSATFTNVTKDVAKSYEDNDRMFNTAHTVYTDLDTTKTVSVDFGSFQTRCVLGVAAWR